MVIVILFIDVKHDAYIERVTPCEYSPKTTPDVKVSCCSYFWLLHQLRSLSIASQYQEHLRMMPDAKVLRGFHLSLSRPSSGLQARLESR